RGGLRRSGGRFRRGVGRGLCGALRALGAGLGRSWLELEADLAIGAAHQIGLELAPGPHGDEAGKEVGPAFGEQLAHLLRRDLLLQDDLPRREVAAALRADRTLADVLQAVLEHARAALREIGRASCRGRVEVAGGAV